MPKKPPKKPLEIPKHCLRLVKLIRKYVKSPPPVCRWVEGVRFGENYQCPMGLLPGAITPAPVQVGDFDLRERKKYKLVEDEIADFADWWDSLGKADAREAVRLIWPDATFRMIRWPKSLADYDEIFRSLR